MKIIDKLHTPFDYHCRECKNYDINSSECSKQCTDNIRFNGYIINKKFKPYGVAWQLLDVTDSLTGWGANFILCDDYEFEEK